MDKKKRVDVFVNDALFTSYMYTDQIADLKKTVLFPVKTAEGTDITRAFPLKKRAGERTDHPHHIGFWFNYGDVNGLDYWNNSNAIPEERRHEMGIIRHNKINKIENGKNKATLAVAMDWLNAENELLLKESTTFIFHSAENLRVIDRITMLTASGGKVDFTDNKEGMIAIRVRRELEHPAEKPITLSDAAGNKTAVPVLDNTGVSGHYLNSEGIEGTDVWGKRAKWVALSGVVNTEDISVVLFDHPHNVGYPTYWHARGYGLFAANPLGQKVFSDGKEELNFSLNKGDTVTFKHRMAIYSSEVTYEQLENDYQNFAKD